MGRCQRFRLDAAHFAGSGLRVAGPRPLPRTCLRRRAISASRRVMQSNLRIGFVLVAVLANALGVDAQTPAADRCADLVKLTFEGNTSIASATLVTSGTTAVSTDTATTTLK